MQSVNPRFRARCTTTAGLVLLAALTVAFLQAKPLTASVSTTAGQAVATPTVGAMDHAAHDVAPADAHGGESDMDMDPNMDMEHSTPVDAHALPDDAGSAVEHTTHVDAHALPDPAASAATGHAEAPENESNAHGHGAAGEAEAPQMAAATRGLVLGGFGAVNGLVIVVAALLKARIARTTKAKRVNRPDNTAKGVSQ